MKFLKGIAIAVSCVFLFVLAACGGSKTKAVNAEKNLEQAKAAIVEEIELGEGETVNYLNVEFVEITDSGALNALNVGSVYYKIQISYVDTNGITHVSEYHYPYYSAEEDKVFYFSTGENDYKLYKNYVDNGNLKGVIDTL